MAHFEKFKSADVLRIINHNRRDHTYYKNGNVNPERSKLNVDLIPSFDAYQRYTDRLAQLKPARKDAVNLLGFVMSLPDGVEEKDADDFFSKVAEHNASIFGAENIMQAVIHKDETKPHLHMLIMPVKDGKLNAKKILDRKFLKGYHGGLAKAVAKDYAKAEVIKNDNLTGFRNQSMEEFKRTANDVKFWKNQNAKLQDQLNTARKLNAELMQRLSKYEDLGRQK